MFEIWKKSIFNQITIIFNKIKGSLSLLKLYFVIIISILSATLPLNLLLIGYILIKKKKF